MDLTLESYVTTLKCGSWMVENLGKHKGITGPPMKAEPYTKVPENYSVATIVKGGATDTPRGLTMNAAQFVNLCVTTGLSMLRNVL